MVGHGDAEVGIVDAHDASTRNGEFGINIGAGYLDNCVVLGEGEFASGECGAGDVDRGVGDNNLAGVWVDVHGLGYWVVVVVEVDRDFDRSPGAGCIDFEGNNTRDLEFATEVWAEYYAVEQGADEASVGECEAKVGFL